MCGFINCRTIYKNRSTENVSAIPFVVSIVMYFVSVCHVFEFAARCFRSILMLKYAEMINNEAMWRINLGALCFNSCYLLFFVMYCSDTVAEVLQPLSIGAAVVAFMFNYAKYEDPDVVQWRYGMITKMLMLAALCIPLFELQTILDKEDASHILLPSVTLGAIISFLWMTYGIIARDAFLVVRFVVGTVEFPKNVLLMTAVMCEYIHLNYCSDFCLLKQSVTLY